MSTDVVGSHMPSLASEQTLSDRGYGQNAYSGASSDEPGRNTTSGFLPKADLAGARSDRRQMQQRPVSADPLSTTFGMHPPKRT